MESPKKQNQCGVRHYCFVAIPNIYGNIYKNEQIMVWSFRNPSCVTGLNFWLIFNENAIFWYLLLVPAVPIRICHTPDWP